VILGKVKRYRKRSFAKQRMIETYVAKDLLLARKIQAKFYGDFT
jgi:hypothetical protein